MQKYDFRDPVRLESSRNPFSILAMEVHYQHVLTLSGVMFIGL